MKRLLFICLLAGTGHAFAQNLDIQDMQSILYSEDMEQSGKRLSAIGFVTTPVLSVQEHDGLLIQNSWQFGSEGKNNVLTTIYRFHSDDITQQPTIMLETSDPYVYSHLMNQLADEGFYYQQTSAGKNKAQIHFTNNREDLLVLVSNQHVGNTFQLRFQPATTRQEGKKVATHTKKVKTTKARKSAMPVHKKTARKTKQ